MKRFGSQTILPLDVLRSLASELSRFTLVSLFLVTTEGIGCGSSTESYVYHSDLQFLSVWFCAWSITVVDEVTLFLPNVPFGVWTIYTANSKKLVKIFFLILRKIILFLEKLSCF